MLEMKNRKFYMDGEEFHIYSGAMHYFRIPQEYWEDRLLKLRAGMGVYSNNRPAKIWSQLAQASPLKKEIVDKGIDFIIVRELIGGIYFGKHETVTENGQLTAVDELRYNEEEIRRIGRIGFETAQKRNKKLCSVEKSNVLDSSRLWKKVMHELAEEYPDVEAWIADLLTMIKVYMAHIEQNQLKILYHHKRYK